MHVSSLKGGVKNGEQEKIQRRFEEEIRRTQIQQEGRPGSPHRDASHALWQTQSKEPQAGHCHRSFQSAAKRRQGSEEKSSLIGTNLYLIEWLFPRTGRTSCLSLAPCSFGTTGRISTAKFGPPILPAKLW